MQIADFYAREKYFRYNLRHGENHSINAEDNFSNALITIAANG